MVSLLFCLVGVMSAGLPPQSADVLWDNGNYDYRTGVLSCRESTGLSWVADDFIADSPWRITAASAEFIVTTFPEYGWGPFVLADLALWEEPSRGDEPGEKVVELSDLPVEWQQIGVSYGFPVIRIKVSGLNLHLPSGAYFFSLRLVQSYRHGQLSYLCTTGDGEIEGWSGGWRIEWPHIGKWYRILWPAGRSPAQLSTSDFAFSLEGERE